MGKISDREKKRMMTIAEEIYGKLLLRLQQGEFPPGSRFPSESLLADLYGVDKKTVNRAVSLLAAEGYVARGVRGAGTRVLRTQSFPKGFLLFISRFSFYHTRLLKGGQDAAGSRGYAAAVLFRESGEELLQTACLFGPRIRGIVSAGTVSLMIRQLGLPFVSVDFDDAEAYPDINMVNTDNYRGAYELMREALRRGHREILIYSSGREYVDRQNRLRGFCDAMRQAGIGGPEKRIFYGTRHDVSAAWTAREEMKRRYPEPSLICCDADDAAESLIRAAVSRGAPLPAVTSFGNTLLSDRPVATVEQFPERIGEYACSKLVEFIELGVPPQAVREKIAPQVVGSEFIPDLTAGRSG